MKKLIAYILLIAGAAALAGGIYLFAERHREEAELAERAEEALILMQEIIPERVQGSIYEEEEEQEMAVLEINGLSLVGYAEIPEAQTAFVVQNEWGAPSVSRMRKGNIRNGTGVIETDRIAVDLISEGMTVEFTDISGTVYEFIVDNICGENEIIQNGKLIIIDEGVSKTIQIVCIEK